MSGYYIVPIQGHYLNLSGGTITGDTVFEKSITAETIYSGSSNLETVIVNLISSEVINSNLYLPISGGTGGPYNFISGITANTLTIKNDILPNNDNISYLGTNIKRFRELNTVNGIAVNFTASTLQIGDRIITQDNIILKNDILDCGEWN